MPLPLNSSAPDFSLPSTTGSTFTLSQSAKGRPLVLYFYPKDFSRVCTKEACEFRDQFQFFRGQQIEIIGISRDNIETHHRFRKAFELPFHLLADEQGHVASLYKASVPLLPLTRRITYLLDAQHGIAGAFEKMFGYEAHIQQMIDKVQQMEP